MIFIPSALLTGRRHKFRDLCRSLFAIGGISETVRIIYNLVGEAPKRKKGSGVVFTTLLPLKSQDFFIGLPP